MEGRGMDTRCGLRGRHGVFQAEVFFRVDQRETRAGVYSFSFHVDLLCNFGCGPGWSRSKEGSRVFIPEIHAIGGRNPQGLE